MHSDSIFRSASETSNIFYLSHPCYLTQDRIKSRVLNSLVVQEMTLLRRRLAIFLKIMTSRRSPNDISSYYVGHSRKEPNVSHCCKNVKINIRNANSSRMQESLVMPISDPREGVSVLVKSAYRPSMGLKLHKHNYDPKLFCTA